MPADAPRDDVAEALAAAGEAELRAWVEEFSGPRHGRREPGALARKGALLAERLAGMGFAVSRRPFRHGGREVFNVVAEVAGEEAGLPPFLAGAHYDAFPGTPGADDNASGVAALLGAGRILARRPPRRPVRLVGFTLEEPQTAADWRYRHGSRRFARRARLAGERYAGVFILEMVGYTDPRPGSQRIPIRLPVPVPDAGVFLGVVGTRRARAAARALREAAARWVPGLPVVAHEVPLRGFLLPMSRMSDQAPFWDMGYPALMLTDTAFLRNPHYHRPTDLPHTLDYAFLARVARALGAALATG